jgi:hypothetical protein
VNCGLHAPAALTLKSPSATHWIGGWLGHRTSQDAVEEKNASLACEGKRTSVAQAVDYRYAENFCYVLMKISYIIHPEHVNFHIYP